MKGIVQPFTFGGVTRLIQSGIINWRPGKNFFFYFKDTISREQNKTIYSSLGITGMALSKQSDLTWFFLSPASQLYDFANPVRWLWRLIKKDSRVFYCCDDIILLMKFIFVASFLFIPLKFTVKRRQNSERIDLVFDA